MRRQARRIRGRAWAAAGLAALALPALADDGPCTLRLDGRVSDALLDEGVPDVQIEVRDVARDTRRATATDAAGAFAVEGLCPGPHHVRAVAAFHAKWERDVDLPSPPLAVELHEDAEVIEVVATPRGVEDTHAIATVTGAALEQARGQDLAETIAQVPGVVVQRGSADTSKPIVRGQQERRLLTLFDGVRHEGQKWGADHAPELDPFAAEAIRVVKGAAGVRYGPDAIGGVILVDPRPLRTAPGVDGAVHLVGATNGLRGTAALRLDGAHAGAPGFAWRVEGDASRGAALRAPGYVLGNTASGTWNAGVTLGYVRRNVDLKVAWRHHALRAGVFYGFRHAGPQELLDQLDADEPAGADAWKASYAIDRPSQAVDHDTAMVRGRFHLGAGDLEATYSWQLDHRREYDVVRQADTAGAQFDLTLRTHLLDLGFTHHAVHVGRANLTGTVGAQGALQENVYTGLPLIPNYRAGDVGLFAHERLWTRAFELELGARYDHRSQTAFLTEAGFAREQARAHLTTGDCALVDGVARCPRTFDTGSVTLGTLWRAVPDLLALKLDLSSASRFPDPDELYFDGTAPTLPVYALGDPSLKTETSWGGALTAELDQAWVALEASGHASWIHNYVYFAPDLDAQGRPGVEVVARGAFPRFAHRAIDAVFYGFDGALTIAPRFPLSLAAQAAVVRGRDASTGDWLLYVPTDRVGGTLTGRPPAAGRLVDSFVSLSGQWVARQFLVDPGLDLAPPPDPYFLLGASIGATVELRGASLDLGVVGSNLLNARYRDYTSVTRYFADEPGWDLRLRATVRFDRPEVAR